VRRVDAILRDAQPHARPRIIPLGETARSAILGRLGAGAESGLLELVADELPNEEWLRKIASYSRSENDKHGLAVKARIPFESPAVFGLLLLLSGRASPSHQGGARCAFQTERGELFPRMRAQEP
jgi:hypothetical protein